jgi:DNA-binding beta-propeller fold protein YncE
LNAVIARLGRLENIMLTRISLVAGTVVCFLLAVAASAQDSQPSSSDYRVVKKFEIGGEGRWDYVTVDPEARRLYVPRSTHVMVLDADSGKTVGDIPDTEGVHGVALAPDSGRGFTSNGRANTATIFDLKTLQVLGTVKTGENPDAVLFDPFTKRVFTFNGRSQDATAFDAADGKIVGTIALGGKPEAGVSDGKGQVFVNIEDKSEIVRIDPKELKVTARWPIAPGEEPSGLALDAKNRRLFSVCGNEKMVVLDADSGQVITTLPIGKGTDGAAFDAETGQAYSSNGDGTLTVVQEVDPTHFSVAQTVQTQRGARTIALDPKTHKLYLPTAQFEAPPTSAPTTGRARPNLVPNSFTILVVGK